MVSCRNLSVSYGMWVFIVISYELCELFVNYIASLALLKTISSGEGEFYVEFIICLPFDMSFDRFMV